MDDAALRDLLADIGLETAETLEVDGADRAGRRDHAQPPRLALALRHRPRHRRQGREAALHAHGRRGGGAGPPGRRCDGSGLRHPCRGRRRLPALQRLHRPRPGREGIAARGAAPAAFPGPAADQRHRGHLQPGHDDLRPAAAYFRPGAAAGRPDPRAPRPPGRNAPPAGRARRRIEREHPAHRRRLPAAGAGRDHGRAGIGHQRPHPPYLHRERLLQPGGHPPRGAPARPEDRRQLPL